MATKNEEQLTETAAALLTSIKEAADGVRDPGSLRSLAEAFSLVAGNDPKRPGRVGSF